jgi:hypothetical protein
MLPSFSAQNIEALVSQKFQYLPRSQSEHFYQLVTQSVESMSSGSEKASLNNVRINEFKLYIFKF